MSDRKITVTDEMVRALRREGDLWQQVQIPSDATARNLLTAALDAAPTTDKCPAPEVHEGRGDDDRTIPWKTAALNWEARAEKAEQERDEARAEARSAVDQHALCHENRPTTAREHLVAAWEAAYVPDDGIIPARSRYISRDRIGKTYVVPGWHVTQPAVAEGLERRLLDPPTPKRPDGAEEIESALRGELSNLIDENGRSHGSIDGINGLADRLASRGVRVTETEEPR